MNIDNLKKNTIYIDKKLNTYFYYKFYIDYIM